MQSVKFSRLRLDKNMISSMNFSFMDLPSPKNGTYLWNLGFSLVCFLMMQIISGLLLAMCYMGDVKISFSCMDLMMRDVNYGWVVRNFHSNGASFFFLSLYMHMSRGLYYFSFFYMKVWLTGLGTLVLSMAIGFFGYVLPWGQMSYWAATVITKLFSIMPFLGLDMVQWLWGGFAVSLPTLTRFFALHYLCPFILMLVVFLHIVFLHENGSKNPLGVKAKSDKMPFSPYYMEKDLYSQSIMLLFYLIIVFYFPYKIMKTVNFIEAKPLVTPEHMEPEWYLLAPYTILRSMPSKVGGVMMLMMFFIVLGLLPFYMNSNMRYLQFKNKLQRLFFIWTMNYMFLTWAGSVPPEHPFLFLSQISCGVFFFYFVLLGMNSFFID